MGGNVGAIDVADGEGIIHKDEAPEVVRDIPELMASPLILQSLAPVCTDRGSPVGKGKLSFVSCSSVDLGEWFMSSPCLSREGVTSV